MQCMYLRKISNLNNGINTIRSRLCTYVCCRVDILSFGNERIDNCHVALFELWRENLTIRQTLLVLWILFWYASRLNGLEPMRADKNNFVSEVTLFLCILFIIF